jgi:hypothetical protein
MVKFVFGLDLGQASDYTALAILERLPGKTGSIYHIRRLERVRGASYPDIVYKVTAMMRSPALSGSAALVIDQTGCVRPVFDMFEKARLNPIGVSIHGGDSVNHEGKSWKVPKRDLVGCMQVHLQNKTWQVSSKLKLGETLSREMLNFRQKIDPITAHDSYSAWRESEHDDLILAAAVATWWGEREPKPLPRLAFVLPMPKPCEMVAPAWKTIGGYQ